MSTRSRVLVVGRKTGEIDHLIVRVSQDEYEVLRAYDGKQALDLALHAFPDIAIVDAMLPDMDGYEVTRRLKNTPKMRGIPVVLLTASGSPDANTRGLEAGADEFLSYPVDATELQARLQSLIALRRYEEQLQSRLRSEKLFALETQTEEAASSKTVLLVEDDEVSAKLILSCLKDCVCQIEHVTDGVSAVARAEKGDVDVILLDILLPGIDGFEVCQQIKKLPLAQHTQIVMITCLTDVESKIKGIELGVDDFFVKPIIKEVLVARVRALLRKKESIDRLTAEYAQAIHSAMTDPLTGLYNHGYFKQFLKLEIERSMRRRHPLTVMLFDIDDFKQYNDRLGHLIGDQILCELGQVVTSSLRQIDMAARYGGEEFGVVLPYTDLNGARVVAERLRQAVETYPFTYKTKWPEKNLTISIGLATFPTEQK